MALSDRIAKDLITAMKAKDQGALRALRAIKSEILLFQTSGSGAELDEAAEIKMLQKMVKQRKDSIDIYKDQGRDDLAVIEEEEVAVISKYLPEQMSEADLQSFVTELIAELGASGMKDMGRVMGEANKRLAGKAEGKAIASAVKGLLTQ